MIRRTSLLITLVPYFIANFHGLSQNESQGVQFQSRASNVESHLCYLAIVLPTFNACPPAKWVQRLVMLQRSFGYEPNDFTTCPLCNNVSGERLRPLPFTALNLRPVGHASKKDGKEKSGLFSFPIVIRTQEDKAKNPYIIPVRASLIVTTTHVSLPAHLGPIH